jgi:hypothetical protein
MTRRPDPLPARPHDDGGPLAWVGPVAVRDLLHRWLDDPFPRLPEAGSAYLVSRHPWTTAPASDCEPLYVGGTTGQSPRFRVRVGELLAALYGMTRGHAGAKSLRHWCQRTGVHPSDLFIGWVSPGPCHRCVEHYLAHALTPRFNLVTPPACAEHGPDPAWFAASPR